MKLSLKWRTGHKIITLKVLEGSRSVGNRQRAVGKKNRGLLIALCQLLTLRRVSLKIPVAYGEETSRNSAAHLRPVRKRPTGAGLCVWRGKWAGLLAPFSFASFSFPEGIPIAWAGKGK